MMKGYKGMGTTVTLTWDDYLRIQGAQMMMRRVCETLDGDDLTFYRRSGDRWEKAKGTPYQLLDAIRRFTASTMGAKQYLDVAELVRCPVFKAGAKRLAIERIDIITKTEYLIKNQ